MAEKEYIEREALINACKKIIHDKCNDTTAPDSWSHAYADFIDDINELAIDLESIYNKFHRMDISNIENAIQLV